MKKKGKRMMKMAAMKMSVEWVKVSRLMTMLLVTERRKKTVSRTYLLSFDYFAAKRQATVVSKQAG